MLLASPMTSTKAPRVLVVDDHELTRCTLKLALGMQCDIAGVDVACNGKEALAKMQHQPVDVVLLDLHMPVMDGWTASNHIREQFPNTKIVVYSAAEGSKKQAVANGAQVDAFCDKGACTCSLLATIRQVLAAQ
jgi:CheY-like chemotaxis protein